MQTKSGKLVILSLTAVFFWACTSIPDLPAVDNQSNPSGLDRGGWGGRYFQYNGVYDYYVGFDLQQLHADTNVDFREKLDFLAGYGVNKVRIWLNPSWFGLPGDRNYPSQGKILYPWSVNPESNKFDIDQWDPEFWDRTREFLAYARSKEFIVEISLFSIQEPRNYFKDNNISYPFNYRNNVQNFGRPSDEDGRFMRGFFDIEYSDNGRKLADFHRSYIDKALDEFGEFNHIYYELINESPGVIYWVNHELPHAWMKYWMSYVSSRTDRIVTTHNHGFMNLRKNKRKRWTAEDFNNVGQRYWDESFIDGFNFHLYSSNPGHISMALNGYQLKGKLLICNEGDTYYDINRLPGYPNFVLDLRQDDLYAEIRHAWGMMTSAGYYSIYYGPVPQLGDESSVRGAEAMQAMRSIVEMVEFQNMRPVRSDGTEYDDLVMKGPTPHWQVIADVGESYIIYLWGAKSTSSLAVNLQAGHYRYDWMDTRSSKETLAQGEIMQHQSGRAEIEPPPTTSWHSDAGIVLVIRNYSTN